MKIISNGFGERPVLKLMYAATIRLPWVTFPAPSLKTGR
jgi:hypothetical protein